ncbi:MAG: ADP-forming succinate--CoA ligase subunit beta [Caldilineaceae bacterium]|nr:ADP-forming succinate--CoA ligase subunit beta [Caldilineaceae bacterium]MBP8106778.1 ADP-forming succinate--CoA ligase subunit beta [Caldilineaceae bacterium]MBP8120994.1 ADP-forming succinate--CoA ligase subunit beta [Caldilineaceae bacterium]MBP9071791.1 ADP-forming succinate--CoA ligase subunit beta [Caldilineaceae bacterium]
MKLQEYQSKRIFAQYGIPIPKGDVADNPADVRQIAKNLGGPVVIKSQVLVGGRGKAGGIKVAKTPEEAERISKTILGMEIKGLTVKKVLVDEASDIRKEIYLGAVLDRAARRVVIMASSEGGVEIEKVAAETPEKIITVRVDPFLGFRGYQANQLAKGIDLPKEYWRAFAKIATGLYNAYVDTDANLAEINPLVIDGSNSLVAVDGKIVLDDSGLYRHPNLAEMRDADEEDASEREARHNDLTYINLDGEIGCMVNGAGLAMATMDIVKLYGGNPANFLDIGGGATAERVTAALRIILADSRVKAVLINIFGGITRCDEVARGIIEAINTLNVKVPFVVRLVGTNEEEGRALLADADLITATTLADAAEKAVAAAKGEIS